MFMTHTVDSRGLNRALIDIRPSITLAYGYILARTASWQLRYVGQVQSYSFCAMSDVSYDGRFETIASPPAA
jgi:hypothetical protein